MQYAESSTLWYFKVQVGLKGGICEIGQKKQECKSWCNNDLEVYLYVRDVF